MMFSETAFKRVFSANDAPLPMFKVTVAYPSGERFERVVDAASKRDATFTAMHMKDERPTLCSVVRMQ